MSQNRQGLSPSKAGVADTHVVPLPSLQGKEEFEKTQKELLEKGNIIRQSKDQLEHQQVIELGWASATGHSSWGGLGVLFPLYPLLLSWTTASSCVAALVVGSGLSPMPRPCQQRGIGTLLLERSLAQLSWGWHCPLPFSWGAQLSPRDGGHGHPCWWLQGGERALA